jgi:hypothetical protein
MISPRIVAEWVILLQIPSFSENELTKTKKKNKHSQSYLSWSVNQNLNKTQALQ